MLIAAGVEVLQPHFGLARACECMYLAFNPLVIVMTLCIFIAAIRFSPFFAGNAHRRRLS